MLGKYWALQRPSKNSRQRQNPVRTNNKTTITVVLFYQLPVKRLVGKMIPPQRSERLAPSRPIKMG